MATRDEVVRAIEAYEERFGYLPNEHDMLVISLVLNLPQIEEAKQTYTDGTPIQEGDTLRITLDDGYTTDGVAAYCPWGDKGVLYLKRETLDVLHARADTTYVHINHGGILVKLPC